MNLAIVEISVVPLGTETPSVSKYVAACHKVLEEQSQVSYTLTPMGTILEGKLEHCLELAKKLHETPFNSDIQRVTTTIKIDDRRDKESSMEQKLSSVQSKNQD